MARSMAWHMEGLTGDQSSPGELHGHNIPVLPRASGRLTGDTQPRNESCEFLEMKCR